METARDYTVGTIKHSIFFGEITALGVIGDGKVKLSQRPTFKYSDTDSWKYLYGKESQCVFKKNDNDKKTLDITFYVDGVQAATAQVSGSGDLGNVDLTRGSCIWT